MRDKEELLLDKKDLDRLNELARKAKSSELTAEENEEREKLRQEYLKRFRKSFRQRLENIEIHYVEDEEIKQ